MSTGQIVLAVITAIIAASGLAWTIFSWLRGRRPEGPMIAVQLATGEIYDHQDQLIAYFPNGNVRNMHVERIQSANDKPMRRNKGASNPRDNTKQPVNAVFVQNRGKTAVSIRRCEYLTPIMNFEPQRAASCWGDVLPKRLEPGDEAVFIHERTEMRVFLNGVMRDQRVAQMFLLPVVTLGTGHEVSANIPLVIKADMTEDELAAVKNFDKEIKEEPPNEFLDVPKKRRLPWQRKPKKTLIARNYADD